MLHTGNYQQRSHFAVSGFKVIFLEIPSIGSHLVHIGSEHTAFHFELQNHDLFLAEEDHIWATARFIRQLVFEDQDELWMLHLNGR